jgi:hypothetical protein
VKCDVHKGHAVIGHGLAPVGALSLGCGRGMTKLREAVITIVRARLRIYPDTPAPPHNLRHNSAVLDVFLSLPADQTSVLYQSRARTRESMRILLNGHWGSRFIDHYCCGCCSAFTMICVFTESLKIIFGLLLLFSFDRYQYYGQPVGHSLKRVSEVTQRFGTLADAN